MFSPARLATEQKSEPRTNTHRDFIQEAETKVRRALDAWFAQPTVQAQTDLERAALLLLVSCDSYEHFLKRYRRLSHAYSVVAPLPKFAAGRLAHPKSSDHDDDVIWRGRR